MEALILANYGFTNYGRQPDWARFAGTEAEERYYLLYGGNSCESVFPTAALISIVGLVAVGFLFPY